MWTLPKNLKKFIDDLATALSILLICGFTLSLGARLHWFLDLFSHFSQQYFIGGLLLTPLLVWQKKKLLLVLVSISMLTSGFEVYRHVESVPSKEQPSLRIVQYNRNVGLTQHDKFIAWIKSHKDDFDVVVMQEATPSIAKAASDLGDLFPHQIHEPRDHAFGMVILSKYPMLTANMIPLNGPTYSSFAAKITIQPPSSAPVTIYALHALPPMGADKQKQRNFELFETAKHIAQDTDKNIIMMGDWNITPYSPYFSDLLEKAGLHYQISGPYPFPTWPSHFVPIILQIPIDHILTKGDLVLIEKKRGPALGSDHYPVIASFALRTHD